MSFIFILFVLLILIYILKNSKNKKEENITQEIVIKEINERMQKNNSNDSCKNNLAIIKEEVISSKSKCEELNLKAREHIEKINDLKINFGEVFFPYEYTKIKAGKVEKIIEKYYNEEKKLILLAKEYNIASYDEMPSCIKYEIDEFYIYNMAQCYFYQNKFKEAQEVFEYGFDHIYLLNLFHNLKKSYKNFLEILIEKKELSFFFYSIDRISSKIKLEDEFIENISYEIGELLEIKNFFLLFIEALKTANQNNEVIKLIIKRSEVQLKVFKNLDYSEANFKGKNYEKALEYFEVAINNSTKFDEDISYMYELYGDILYKLKKYNEAIKAYDCYSKNCEDNHRIFSKIGDSYKMLKQNEKAFYYYIFSLKINSDYKTAQTKLISISKKINKNINLEEIIKFLKNNPNTTFEKIKEIF